MTEGTPPPPPTLTHVLHLAVTVGPPVELGTIDGLRRRVIPILGGEVTGRLTAQVLPGGTDWQSIDEPAGVTRLDARYWLRATDGTMIAVHNTGLRIATPTITQALAAGHPAPTPG